MYLGGFVVEIIIMNHYFDLGVVQLLLSIPIRLLLLKVDKNKKEEGITFYQVGSLRKSN